MEFRTTGTSSSDSDASPCATRAVILFLLFGDICLRLVLLTSNLSSETPKVTLLRPISINGANGLFKIMRKACGAQIEVGEGGKECTPAHACMGSTGSMRLPYAFLGFSVGHLVLSGPCTLELWINRHAELTMGERKGASIRYFLVVSWFRLSLPRTNLYQSFGQVAARAMLGEGLL